MPAVRGLVNEVIKGVLFQRGQILTWPREKKYSMLRQHKIKTVVNFWPKMDSDMAEAPLDNYLLLSAPRSEQMLEGRIEQAARFVSALTCSGPALVLCEAGVTRSVYFCVLVASELLNVSPLEAARHLEEVGLSTARLKGFMQKRLEELTEGAE
jgi:hypothetical protein